MSAELFSKAISNVVETQAGKKPEGFVQVAVRPGEKVSAMLDVIAHLYKRSPSEFIADALSKKLADFALSTPSHADPIVDAVQASLSGETAINPSSALGILQERGIVHISNPFVAKLDL